MNEHVSKYMPTTKHSIQCTLRLFMSTVYEWILSKSGLQFRHCFMILLAHSFTNRDTFSISFLTNLSILLCILVILIGVILMLHMLNSSVLYLLAQ